MNAIEYQSRREMLKLEYDINLVRLELESKRACLTSYDNYVDENETILQMKKRLMLGIEEQKIKLRILLFELEVLKKETKQILEEE